MRLPDHEEINGQDEVCTHSYQKHGNEEEGRIVAFVTEVRLGDEMIFGIIGVMEVDMVVEELTAHWMVAELVMHQCLPKRHDQMRRDGSHEIEQKRRQ